jgi:hypothetical protein
VLRHVSPARLPASAALLAALLVVAVLADGVIANAGLISVGLATAIRDPTLYVLARPTRADQATSGAIVLCVAVVGGAAVPPLTGHWRIRLGWCQRYCRQRSATSLSSHLRSEFGLATIDSKIRCSSCRFCYKNWKRFQLTALMRRRRIRMFRRDRNKGEGE